jgi:hypothetical protein
MRYRLMATYRGAPYEAGIGPADGSVVLFAACPPPEELGFEPATGHWRKELQIQDVQAVWQSRPVGRFRGERCVVLDDLGDRLHICYLGHDALTAERLGYWQVDRGVFELIAAQDEVTDIVEERSDFPDRPGPGQPGDYPSLPPAPEPGYGLPPASQTGPGYLYPAGSAAAAARMRPLGDGGGDWGGLGLPPRAGGVSRPASAADGPLPLEAEAMRAASAATRREQPAPPGRPDAPGPHAAGPLPNGPVPGGPAGSASVPNGSGRSLPPGSLPPGSLPPGSLPDRSIAPSAAQPPPASAAGPPGPFPPDPDRPQNGPVPASAGQPSPAQAGPRLPSSRQADPGSPGSAPVSPAQPSAARAGRDQPGRGGLAPAGATAPGSIPPGTVPPPAAPLGSPTAPSLQTASLQAAPVAAPPQTGRPGSGHPGPGLPPGVPFAPGPPGAAASLLPPAAPAPAAGRPGGPGGRGDQSGPGGIGEPGPRPESPRRRRSAGRRMATERLFSELASLAAIPAGSYSVGEEVDGAMCLLETPDGFEVFSSAGGARHEIRVFSDEESACFYLFGVLAADAVRTGVLVPAASRIPAPAAPESALRR